MFGRLIGIVTLSALVVVAMAGPQTYAQRVQKIRAGVVILDSAKSGTNQPQSAAPYALYNLDANTSVKPAGWSFYNPYAPSRVTQTIYNRWSNIDPNSATLGTPINKRNAPYWEVFLSQVNDNVLANYDLLLVNPAVFASLNPAEQNRLRRFVDNGGVLWVDPAGLLPGTAGVDQFNNFPIPFVPVSGSGGVQQTDFTNALINGVISLTPGDVSILNAASPTAYVLQGPNFGSDGASSVVGIAGGSAFDFARLQKVAQIGGQPTISIGRIGEGVVVVTSRGVSLKLNRSQETQNYQTNRGYTAYDPILEQDGLTAAKLAVNMIGLVRDSRQQGSSSRKASSSAIDINPPLLQRSSITDPNYGSNLTTTSLSNSSPALYKGLLVTTVNGYLKVYDANPISDLDGDGNSDDGIQDYSLGQPYDEIWQSSQMPGPLSAPVCSEVPGSAPGQIQDEILVVDGTGKLHIFNLTPKNNDGTLSGQAFEAPPVSPPNGSPVLNTSLTGVPMAPTVHEGVAYIVDTVQPTGSNSGRIWAVDLQTGTLISSTGPFVLGGTGASVSFPEFSYGATVGYIPILDNSGGLDKVLYAPFAANLNQGVNAAGFLSVWIGAKGEVPSQISPTPGTTETGTDLSVTTRASSHGGLPIYVGSGTRGVKLTIIDANGNPWSDVQMAQYFTGTYTQTSGVITFPFAGTHNSLPSGTSVRVDYTIDWGDTTPGDLSSVERGRVILPDNAQGPTRVINGAVALSPQGTIYVVNSNETNAGPLSFGAAGGGLYGFREQGVGVFNCVARHELFGQHTEVLNQATDVTVPAVLSDYDTNLQSFAPNILGNPSLSQFTIRGGPSIRNGQVFVTALAKKATPNGAPITYIPATILMAFNAEPQTPSFVVGQISDGSEIIQPDFARSSSSLAPENQSVLGTGSYTYDSNSGIISFPNLMNVQRGQVQNCLSLTQPVIIRQPGVADKLVYPDQIGGSVWNQLQWFHVIDGAYPSGATPVVTGNSVLISMDSSLPTFLNGTYAGGQPQTNGVLYSVNAQIPTSQLHPLTAQPWLNQLWSIDSFTPFTADPNILWPQLTSSTSFSDYVIKLNQTVLSSQGQFVYGQIAGENALAAWGDTGLYTFAKSNFLICDEGRIAEIDPSGNPVWSTDSTASAGQSSINSAANVKSFVRPSKAYKLNESTILFADPGANRVASVNKNGIENRSISSFQLDPVIVPSGYGTNETLKLSGPRDVLYYTTYTQMSAVSGLVSVGDNENANSYEYWQHYLIADTGNKRLVEVIDRYYYDQTTGLIGQAVTVGGTPQVGILLWHSPASATGAKYAYTSVTRIKFPDTNGGHYVYVSGIGGTLPTRVGNGLDVPSAGSLVNAQDGSGGIVIYDPANPAGVVTFSEINVPDVSATSFWDPATGKFDNIIDQTTTDGQLTYAKRKGGIHRLSNLNSVSAKIITQGTNPLLAIMVSDGTGVYEVLYDYTGGATQTLSVDWMMPNEVYRNLLQGVNNGLNYPLGTNANDLRALYARRLDSGEVLIVNGYYGKTLGGAPFTGEVMQVNGTVNTASFALPNLGFSSQSITLDLRTAGSTAFRGLLLPVFADRR